MSENDEMPSNKSIDSSYEARNPVVLDWVFGFNPQVRLLNLTTTNKSFVVAFASGHCVCIYSNETHKMDNLMGHKNSVKMMDSDDSSRFLVTADDQYSINFWDRYCTADCEPIPVHTIFEPFGNESIDAVSISCCAKYLVSTSSSTAGSKVYFWLWTFGHDEPDGEYIIPAKYGSVVNAKFNVNRIHSHFFCVWLTNGIGFGTWNTQTLSLDMHFPVDGAKHIQQLTDATFMLNSRQFVAVNQLGSAIVWSDSVTETCSKPISNCKNFLKSLQLLEDVSLNVVKAVDNMIAVGTANGTILFYDNDLKLLYVCDTFQLDPIVGIEFNKTARGCQVIDDPTKFDASLLETATDEEEILFKQLLPRDSTVKGAIFLVRNFVVVTSSGKIATVDFPNLQLQYILYQADSYVSAFAIHPFKSLICGASCTGRVFLYDYEKNIQISQKLLMKSTQRSSNLECSICSCIAFSPCGNHLFCAMGNGDVWYLDPFMLNSINSEPYIYMNNKIIKIEFSENSIFSVFADDSQTIMLMHFNGVWNLIGKYRQHCKIICEILFYDDWMKQKTGWFTVGEDQHVITYDLEKSLENNKIEMSTIIKIEQTAIPKAALILPSDVSKKFNIANNSTVLMSNDQFKLKIYSLPDFVLLHTFIGPMFDGCIIEMKLLTTEEDNINHFLFCTRKNIGIYLLPIDGNPFRCLGTVVHPIKLKMAQLDNRCKRIISLGEQSRAIGVWKLNADVVDNHFLSGGIGLDPYFSLLPGGKPGWLFKEMQDMFFYMQILAAGIGSAEEKQMKQYINISDVPDFMRGLGFFPTDCQIQNMIAEMSETGRKNTIDFTELVKVFINHREVNGIDLKDIENALQMVTGLDSALEPQIKITKSQLLDLLMDNRGEPVTKQQALEYLNELCSTKHAVVSVSDLEESFDMSQFVSQLLGIQVIEDGDNTLLVIDDDPSKINSLLENKRQHFNTDNTDRN